MSRSLKIDQEIEPADAKRIMVDYLLLKVWEEDWHGVADAAMDIRELEAKHPHLRKQD